MLSRRGILFGLGAVLAAPAIVRIESLMPVRNPRLLTVADILRAKASLVHHISGYRVYLHPEQYRDLLRGQGVLPPAELGTYNGFTFHSLVDYVPDPGLRYRGVPIREVDDLSADESPAQRWRRRMNMATIRTG